LEHDWSLDNNAPIHILSAQTWKSLLLSLASQKNYSVLLKIEVSVPSTKACVNS